MKKLVSVFNFSIQNRSDDEIDIHIDGDVVDASTQVIIKAIFGDDTTTSYKSFRNQIEKTSAKTINVIINSPGGHVGDALAIYDLLIDMQNKGKTVNTIGRGIVASSATLILMAGKTPEMSENSWFMMHTVSGGAFGTVDEVENYAKTMRKFNDKIRDLYASNSGMRSEEVTKLMNAETWLTAQDAKAKGLIKIVTGRAEFTNKIEADHWEYSDTSILNQYNNSVKPVIINQNEDMKKLIAKWGEDLMNAIKGISITDKTDSQALVNSIAEVMKTSITSLSEQMDTEVNSAVENSIKGEAVTALINSAVTTAVTNAVKPLQDKVNELEKTNKELETEIQNKIGGASAAAQTKERTPEKVGAFD